MASWLGTRRRQQRALIAAPVAALVALAWQRRWMSDDGFIHLRIVKQIVAMHGPVYNMGERVEASTSPLWVALLSVLEPLPGLALPWKAVLLGIILTAAGVVLAFRGGAVLFRRSDEDDSRLLLPLGAFVVAALAPFWDFATSGLETGLTFGWIGLSYWWCARRVTLEDPPSRRAERAGAVLVGLGWLIRPDLAVVSVAFAVPVLLAVARLGRRRLLGAFGAMVALPALYQLFRMGYYAMLVPNTALAKEAGKPQWGKGWNYLVDFFGPYWLWLPLAVGVGVMVQQALVDRREGDRLRLAARVAPVVGAVVHGAYIVRVGGDFMHARLLLPSVFLLLAPFVVPLPSGAVDWRAWMRTSNRAATAGLVVVVWSVVCGGWLRNSLASSSEIVEGEVVPVSADGTIEDERALLTRGVDDPVRPDRAAEDSPFVVRRKLTVVSFEGFAMAPLAKAPWNAAATPAGLVGGAYAWDTDVYVIEFAGLGQPVTSHFEQMASDRRLGHQKTFSAAWQVAVLSKAPAARNRFGGLVAERDDVKAARRATNCGQLDEYLDDIHHPLTPGRFLGNVLDSFQNTTFRLSSDPQEAREELCG
jgi:arabinofuranosyltransferase